MGPYRKFRLKSVGLVGGGLGLLASVLVPLPAAAGILSGVSVTPNPAPALSTVSITVAGQGSCLVRLDFGDKSSPQTGVFTFPMTISHSYLTLGTFTITAKAPADINCTVTGGQQTATLTVLKPQTTTGEPQAPENIQKVNNAIEVYAKSLTIVVRVKPGLALTKPVQIEPVIDGVKLGMASYATTTVNRFRLEVLGTPGTPAGEGKPRSVRVDITLSEGTPGGGSYTVSRNVKLDPLYDVTTVR